MGDDDRGTGGPAAPAVAVAGRAPHVAEQVAAALRDRILDGELAEGDELPKQEDLQAEFGVSLPSVRGALRILEAEGLIRVRRGKVGGAVVRPPRASNVAYTLSLVLRSTQVGLDDARAALHLIEPLCAALCAERPDRATEVVPRLKAAHHEATLLLDDPAGFTPAARRFHEELVACSGNHTIMVVLGAIETVWSSHAAAWSARHVEQDGSPDRAYRRASLRDHEQLIRAIERGDATGAARKARRHLESAPIYSLRDEITIVPTLVLGEAPPEGATPPA